MVHEPDFVFLLSVNLHNVFLLSILKSAFASAGTKKTTKVTTRARAFFRLPFLPLQSWFSCVFEHKCVHFGSHFL